MTSRTVAPAWRMGLGAGQPKRSADVESAPVAWSLELTQALPLEPSRVSVAAGRAHVR
jgi:hypothetical protein